MTNEQILEQELENQYAFIQNGKSVVTAIDDAVFDSTGQRLNEDEKIIIADAPLTGLRDFIDWVLNKVKQLIEWIKNWLDDDDE